MTEAKSPRRVWELHEIAGGGVQVRADGKVLYSAGGAEDVPFKREDLERLVHCVNACRGLTRPERLPQALKILRRISAGCPAKPGRWLYDHEMAELARQALQLLTEKTPRHE